MTTFVTVITSLAIFVLGIYAGLRWLDGLKYEDYDAHDFDEDEHVTDADYYPLPGEPPQMMENEKWT